MTGSDNVCNVNKTKDLRLCDDSIKYSAQLPAPPVGKSIIARACRGCGQPFDAMDRRRKFCSGRCQRDTFSASLRRRQAEHRAKFPEREIARQTLNNAINTRQIRRPWRCEKCGVECRAHGHHTDYARPLYVTWLCRACHAGLEDGRHFGCGQRKDALQAPPSSPEQPQGDGDVSYLLNHARTVARPEAARIGNSLTGVTR